MNTPPSHLRTFLVDVQGWCVCVEICNWCHGDIVAISSHRWGMVWKMQMQHQRPSLDLQRGWPLCDKEEMSRKIWSWKLTRRYWMTSTYHHHCYHLLRDARWHVKGMVKRQPLKVEDPNTTIDLSPGFHDSNLQNYQSCLEEFIHRNLWRFPVSKSVDQHPFSGLIPVWRSRHDIFFTQRL